MSFPSLHTPSSILRTWILFSILWFVLVALYAWQNFPDISDAQRERIEGLYVKLMERERRINPEFAEKYGHVTAAGLADNIVREGKADIYAANILEKWGGEVDFSGVETRFEERRRQLPLERTKCVGRAVAFWAFPVVVSFFLGWVLSRARHRRE
jgi:hypothetical protein